MNTTAQLHGPYFCRVTSPFGSGFPLGLAAYAAAALLSLAGVYAAESPALPTPAAGVTVEPVTKMKPFKVLAEWVEIRPMLRKGVIDHIRIAHVQAASPAADAGLLPGMQVVELQGISVPGKSEPDFFERLLALPAASQLSLKVRALTYDGSFVLILPLSAPKLVLPDKAPVLNAAREIVSADEAKARLVAARRVIDHWVDQMPHISAPLDGGLTMGMSAPDWSRGWNAARGQLSVELKRLLPAHLELFCAAAENAGRSEDGRLRYNLLIELINARTDYEPAQKATVLQHLPKLPELIVTMTRMDWAEGSEAILRDCWNKVKNAHMQDDLLDWLGAHYACYAARAGALDALVAIASTLHRVRTTDITKTRETMFAWRSSYAAEIETLQALAPQQSADITAGAEFVLKNRKRLIFDEKQRKFMLKP
jgi:hypothetical protein